jgi:uroporphyrinogen-III synthase
MIRAVLILRPQPGAGETAERARARGLEPVVAPMFTIAPLEWSPPPAARFDAILFTSANAARHGGEGLAAFRHLPCYAVGEATADAAAEAGFSQIRIGPSDAAAVAQLMVVDGVKRAFHPSAPEVSDFPDGPLEIERIPVYSAQAADRLSDVAVAAVHAGAIVLLHSPRAAALFAERIGDRRGTARIAAISDAAAAAAGPGWAGVGVAMEPRDEALLAAADELAEATAPGLEPSSSSRSTPPTQRDAAARRSWFLPLLIGAGAFLLGLFAMAWVLLQWDSVGRFLGIVPEAPEPVAESGQPQRQFITPEGPNAPIDPDIASRVAMLEQRLGQVGTDAQAAVGNSDRAEGLLVAFAARRALDRGVGLGFLEGLLRQRFGQSQPQAVETIIAASRQPVTLQTLQEQLATAGPQLSGAAPGQTFFQAVQQEFANLIVVRRESTQSTDPRERLRRATSRLEAGQVAEALGEVSRMPGRENAREWMDAAQRYVTARLALDRIETASLLEPRMPAQQPAPSPEAGQGQTQPAAQQP